MVNTLIWISTIICFILTIIFMNIYGKNSGFIFPIVLIHLGCSFIMLCVAVILYNFEIINDTFKYLISFAISFILIVLILNHLDGSNILLDINEPYFVRDFMTILFPYILSNIICFIILFFYSKK